MALVACRGFRTCAACFSQSLCTPSTQLIIYIAGSHFPVYQSNSVCICDTLHSVPQTSLQQALLYNPPTTLQQLPPLVPRRPPLVDRLQAQLLTPPRPLRLCLLCPLPVTPRLPPRTSLPPHLPPLLPQILLWSLPTTLVWYPRCLLRLFLPSSRRPTP